MLILTRRVSETVVIDNGKVTVTVLGVKGNQVRIGVNAPKEMAVDREEIFRKKVNQNEVVDQSPARYVGTLRLGGSLARA